MADTLNFGPEWLRALSDGNSVKSPPPIIGSKYKLAENRYGREEMLALYSDKCKIPEPLTSLPSIVVEKSQTPMSLTALSEEEQRLISTSVNSQAVLRLFGRGGPPTRGGRGAVVERGRGRGRGRGEGFPPRTSFEEGEAGLFGRPRCLPKNDAWEEVGAKRFDRSFSGQLDEGPQRKEFNRSQSNDNWREREREREQEQEIDNDGDWRRAGSKWNTRTSWRDPVTGREKGYDINWQNKPQKGLFPREKNRDIYRSRTSESWDDEEMMPEWSTPGSEEIEELGTFDASGAFVSNKSKAREKGKETVSSDTDHPKDDSMCQQLDVEGGEEREVDQQPEVSLQETVPVQAPCLVKENVVKKDKNKMNECDRKIQTIHTDTQNNIDDRHIHTATLPEIKHPLHEGAPGMPSRTREGNLELETAALNDMEETVESMVAQMTAENCDSGICVQDEEKTVCTVLPMDHENAMKWFYRDPQGDLQGPFNASEMAEWFSAGYFTMNLMVKRGCDEKFSPLGELIKHWARVPFVPGPSMPPLLNNPPPPPSIAVNHQQEHLKLLQQQFFIQQQFLRQMQMQQIQQIQQMMSQLQEDKEFNSLPLVQQQHLAMQCLMGQQLPNAAKRSSPTEMAAADSSPTSHPAFHRSHSQPANISRGKSEEVSIWNTGTSVSSGNLSLPTSVWDLDNQQSISQIPEDMEAHIDKLRKKEEAKEKLKDQEVQQQQDELRRKLDEILRQREAVERERAQLEKFEIQRIEEARGKKEEEEQKRLHIEKLLKQQEQQRRFEEEQKQRQEEELRRKREKEMRQQQEEEIRRQQEEKVRKEEQRRQQEALRRLEELQKQQEEEEYRRQEELQKQQEEEEYERQEELKRQEMEKQKHLDIQRNQEMQRQQQEALRKLQQEQLTKLQLPAHAQWGSQSHQNPQPQQPTLSLLHIQQQEEHTRQQEEEFQRQVEIQRQQMLAIQEQQQQQQQQKTWAAQRMAASQQSAKSLLEIQEEQAKQLQQEQSLQQEKKQYQAKNVNSTSAVWSSSSSSSGSGWASEGSWTSSMLATENNQMRNNCSQSLGFWDDAVQSAPKKSSKTVDNTPSSDFPSLGSSVRTTAVLTVNKQTKASRNNKDEEAVQRLFQTNKSEDSFTQWCTNSLRNLATSVDIPTFVAFLQEIESPYEVYDYVRSYLGESKAARDFGKQFLEKRSEFYGRKKFQSQESSMPSLAEAFAQPTYRQPQQSYEPETQKAKGKKKKKMTKIDSSVLGFTVHAAPDRINIGEIDTLDGH